MTFSEMATQNAKKPQIFSQVEECKNSIEILLIYRVTFDPAGRYNFDTD